MNKYKVLIVDDEPNIVKIMEYELRKHEYVVMTAGNGEEALAAIGKEAPDLIITDVMMPKMDGYELCRQVKERPQWRSIPFIFLTAKTGIENKVYGYSLGAQKYLTKPTSREELLKAVDLRLKLAEDARKLFAKKAKKFDGDLAVISIFSLLDMFFIGGWTGHIDLKTPENKTGRIEVSGGEIKKCIANGMEDSSTLVLLLGWDKGTFSAAHD